MAVTPQTNTDLAEIAQVLHAAETIALCGHISPDGDCLGSQLVLYHALVDLGKQVTCLLAKAEPIEEGLRFLPGIDGMVPASEYDLIPDVFLVVDAPHPRRLGDAAAAIHEKTPITVTVDHHAHDEAVSRYTYVDPAAASTTMLAWRLVAELGVERTADIATCAYTGLVTDTGRFQFQNTDTDAFKAAFEMVSAGADPALVARHVFQSRSHASLALESRMLEHMRFSDDESFVLSYLERQDFEKTGAVKADAEPLINVLRSLASVRVACILREEPDHIRGSFRAKDDTDVAALAQAMGGGGHKAAAGFTLYESLEDALVRVEGVVGQVLAPSAAVHHRVEDVRS